MNMMRAIKYTSSITIISIITPLISHINDKSRLTFFLLWQIPKGNKWRQCIDWFFLIVLKTCWKLIKHLDLIFSIFLVRLLSRGKDGVIEDVLIISQWQIVLLGTRLWVWCGVTRVPLGLGRKIKIYWHINWYNGCLALILLHCMTDRSFWW